MSLFAGRRGPVAGMVLVAGLAGCIWNEDATSRDVSGFETYEFSQRPGLGFCADPDRLFAARLTRGADGGMTLATQHLALAGPDPETCDDGVADDRGCFMPQAPVTRALTGDEMADVAAVFAEVSYFKGPDPICREMGIDPCVIRTHAWDDLQVSDFICGGNRLTEEESAALDGLLERLAAR